MFWSKKDPAERTTVKEYWKATDTVSRPMAIALTLLIGFICLAVTFSLIMGGRWVYQNLSNNDKNTAQTTETNDGITDVGESGSSTSSKTDANSSQNSSSATPTPTPSATRSPNPTPTIKKSNTTSSNNNSALPGSGPIELPNSGPSPE